MSGRKNPRIVNNERNIQEFIPCPARSYAKSEPDTEENRPLDEIALLKRGDIDKMGHHRQTRGKKVDPGNNAPISLKELTERGLQLENGKVVYVPPKKDDVSSQRSARSVSEKSYKLPFSSVSNRSLVDKVQATTVYRVGLPQEKATLGLGETKNGKHYDFRVDKFQLVMQVTDKTTLIIATND